MHIAVFVKPDKSRAYFSYRGAVETEKEAHRFKDSATAHKAAKEELGLGSIRQLPDNEARTVMRNGRVKHKGWNYYVIEVKA